MGTTYHFPATVRKPRQAVKVVDLAAVHVPRETLFKWLSAAKLVVMYPGMQERLGAANLDEVQAMVFELEEAIGVVKGNPDFEGF